MNILITGAGGFLGRKIAELLILKGHKVYNLSRSKYNELEKIGVECILGDIVNTATVEKALENKEVVFHVAAKVGMWGRYNDFLSTNVMGTKNILQGCQKNNVKKLIYTSTPSVVFGKDDLENVDESTPYPQKYLSHYAQTKAMAEKLVLQANNIAGLATCALRPHLIFGPNDPNLIPTLIESAQKNRLKIVGNGENLVDIIFIDNAATAHIQAMEKLALTSKVAGNAYFLGQKSPVNLWDFINDVLKIYGEKPITKKISFKKAYHLGYFLELLYKAQKKYNSPPPMTRFIALQLAKSHYFRHTKAQEDFNFTPEITTSQALERLNIL